MSDLVGNQNDGFLMTRLKYTIYKESMWQNEGAAIPQTDATQLPLQKGERGGLVVNASDSGSRAPLGSNRVVSLSKAHLLPKSTGNTQEAVAPSQHD